MWAFRSSLHWIKSLQITSLPNVVSNDLNSNSHMVATFINWAAQWRRQKILPGNQLVQFFQTVKKSLQIGENKKIDVDFFVKGKGLDPVSPTPLSRYI